MPEEILVLFVFSIFSVSVLTLVKMILNHRKSNRETHSVSSRAESGSMTTSELEGMMRRAVEQSITGLSGKIENLEMEVARLANDKPRLVAHDKSVRLELEDEYVDVESVPVRQKSRA
ncbi:MAG: hypothetical protein O3B41_03255 [Bacteroidetes bacterium]|nr:hypothetical protein [Bacteroidota bacterium]